LVAAWQKAVVYGEPLLLQEPIVLVEGKPQINDAWFTPLMAMMILLMLCIANLFWNQPYFDWFMLAVQTLIGVFMMYVICISDLCCTSWNWLIIPFNILPLLVWRWRKYWALPYACALLIWCIVMAGIDIWGYVLVDWPHILLVFAWNMIILKQYIQNPVYKNRTK
jgi:hypothetical protein